ncbi:MAG TPA: cupredoxin domain-containing protein, partial [Anaerolineales bacterium]|nr:cupredoxin domain-containing protein [Anaerolineales bacterium]
VPMALVGWLLGPPHPVLAPGAEPVSIVIEAGAFAFSPARLEVAEGDTVSLTLRSTDYVHGLHLEGYDLELVADPGQTASVTFTADRPGIFRFRCSVPCGSLHPFMTGRLQVGSSSFPPALLLAFAAAVVGAVFAWSRHRASTSAAP